jgi:hypothetical protein
MALRVEMVTGLSRPAFLGANITLEPGGVAR